MFHHCFQIMLIKNDSLSLSLFFHKMGFKFEAAVSNVGNPEYFPKMTKSELVCGWNK